MPWPTENSLLATIAHEDRRLIERHLEPVLLPIRRKLEVAKKPIEYVYFPESGIASVVSHVNNDRQIEVGLIGREGMTGLAALCYHHGPVQNEVYMQVGGTGYQLSVGHLKEAFAQSRSIHEIMLGFAYSFYIQASATALANGHFSIEERLARWLLMADDRVGGEMPLTHEFLALMLGVRRSGVTVAIQALERKAWVKRRRGTIAVTDRAALQQLAAGIYTAPYGQKARGGASKA